MLTIAEDADAVGRRLFWREDDPTPEPNGFILFVAREPKDGAKCGVTFEISNDSGQTSYWLEDLEQLIEFGQREIKRLNQGGKSSVGTQSAT